MKNIHSLSLDELYRKTNILIKTNETLFHGFIIGNISIDKELIPHSKWRYSFYKGTSKEKSNNKNYSVGLKISNEIIKKHIASCGNSSDGNTQYDITIGGMSVSPYGEITITPVAIKETGLSERELLKRRLTKFCEKNRYFDRLRRPLPRVIPSVLAITSKYSEIHDDLLSNLNLMPQNIKVVNCKTSEEIAEYIKSNDSSRFSIIVLYRGGREDEAMNMFSSEGIIEAIHNCSVPVCVALGHDVDTPFIYAIADKTYSTPSSFGKAISSHNRDVIDHNESVLYFIKDQLEQIGHRKKIYCEKNLDSIIATSKRLQEKSFSKISFLLEKVEHLYLAVFDKKQSALDRGAISINRSLIAIYRNKILRIETYQHNISTNIKQINANTRYKKTLQKEKNRRLKLIIFFCVVVAVLIGIIAFLV